MLQRLSAKSNASHSPARHPVRALVLVPTRELALQVHESVRAYGKYMKMRDAIAYGGVGIKPQIDALRRGVDILVATPGRLLDHVQQRTVDLRQVEILVLDEADRMLDMGFIHDIRKILALLPQKRQNLLFSATFPDEVRKLAGGFMHEPETVEVARRNAPIELVTQVAHPVDQGRKRELLAHLVVSNNWRQVLVFTRTKHGANRLAQQLEREGIDADAIHGNKSQPQRVRALKRFKDAELQVLVATDIAARGIDIDALPHVVNFDLPYVAEDYVHRIGRTGRAGATGDAVSLVCAEDRPLLAQIERLIKVKIEQRVVPGFESSGGAARTESDERAPARGGQRRPQQQQRRPAEGRRAEPRREGDGQKQGQRQGQRQAQGQPRQGQRDGQPRQGQRDGQQRQGQRGRNGGRSSTQQPRRSDAQRTPAVRREDIPMQPAPQSGKPARAEAKPKSRGFLPSIFGAFRK